MTSRPRGVGTTLDAMHPIRWRRVVGVLAVATPLWGCANHITSPCFPETAAHKTWMASLSAANARYAECACSASREPDCTARERLLAACVAEHDARVRAADHDYERSKSAP